MVTTLNCGAAFLAEFGIFLVEETAVTTFDHDDALGVRVAAKMVTQIGFVQRVADGPAGHVTVGPEIFAGFFGIELDSRSG